MNCELTHLSNLCKVITKGTTPTTIGFDFSEKGIGFLRAQNINDGKVDYNRNTLFIDEQTHKALSRSQILPGDILLSIAGTIGRAGIVPDNSPELNCNQAVAIVRTNGKVFRPFLRHWLESLDAQKQMRGAMVTGTISNLSLTQVGNLQIPLPPMEEQQQIADILDRAEALRAKRRDVIAHLDELVQSIFIEMFGNLETNSKGWTVKGFDYFAEIDTKMIKDFSAHENKPHIGIENIEKDTGNLINYKKVGAQNLTSGKYLFTKDHIIYSKIRPNLNKVALPDFDGLCSADAYPLLVNKNNTNRYFFAYILRSKYFLNNILKLSDRTNIPKVNKDQLRSFECICPPIELQNRFANRVETIEKLKTGHRDSLAKVDELFTSLQYRAFRGELGMIPEINEQNSEGIKI